MSTQLRPRTHRGAFRSGFCNDQTDLRTWGHHRCPVDVPNGAKPPVPCQCRCHHRRRNRGADNA